MDLENKMSLWDDVVMRPETAGAFGALLSLRWVPGTSWAARASAFGTGVGFAVYVAPLFIEYAGVTSKTAPLAIAFAMGFLGMNLAAKVIEAVKNLDLVEILSALRSRK